MRLPLREGVDLNMDCHASAIAVLGLPLREGVDLNIKLLAQKNGWVPSPSA